jgi:hypothetical protein
MDAGRAALQNGLPHAAPRSAMTQREVHAMRMGWAVTQRTSNEAGPSIAQWRTPMHAQIIDLARVPALGHRDMIQIRLPIRFRRAGMSICGPASSC